MVLITIETVLPLCRERESFPSKPSCKVRFEVLPLMCCEGNTGASSAADPGHTQEGMSLYLGYLPSLQDFLLKMSMPANGFLLELLVM